LGKSERYVRQKQRQRSADPANRFSVQQICLQSLQPTELDPCLRPQVTPEVAPDIGFCSMDIPAAAANISMMA
jgi:hypothetical protein